MIPALTVREPWASAFFAAPIAHAKNIENRGWHTRHRGLLAIHAGLTPDEGGLSWFDQQRLTDEQQANRGHVLGTVELVSTHDAGTAQCRAHRCDENPWAFWPMPDDLGQLATIVHWVVEHPRKFVTPIKAKGLQMLWTPDPSVAYLIETAEVIL